MLEYACSFIMSSSNGNSRPIGNIIFCLTCSSDISNNSFFYTLAKSTNMFGFFCCHDCVIASEINTYLQAYPVRINANPKTHKDLITAIPDVNMLKHYHKEMEKRKVWKKYLS